MVMKRLGLYERNSNPRGDNLNLPLRLMSSEDI
jgi:hypothetical protein